MSMATRLARFSVILGAGAAALAALPAAAKDFTFDEKTNKQIAAKLKIPVYFAVPASARVALPKDIKTTDKLIDFKHPDAKAAAGDVGLRLVVVKRGGHGEAAGSKRPRANGRPPAHVPLRVGRRRRLSQHPDGHQPHGRRVRRQGRRPAQPRQSAERRVPRRRHAGRPHERALPHAQFHPRHPPAQSHRCPARQHSRLGDEDQLERQAHLPEPDRLQPGLQRAEIPARPVARLRAPVRPDRAR